MLNHNKDMARIRDEYYDALDSVKKESREQIAQYQDKMKNLEI